MRRRCPSERSSLLCAGVPAGLLSAGMLLGSRRVRRRLTTLSRQSAAAAVGAGVPAAVATFGCLTCAAVATVGVGGVGALATVAASRTRSRRVRAAMVIGGVIAAVAVVLLARSIF